MTTQTDARAKPARPEDGADERRLGQENHPTLVQRIAMAERYRERNR